MAASPDETVARLKSIEGYRLQFDKIYGEVTWNGVGDAVGCFVRNLVTGPSPYDYYAHWQVWKDADPEDLQKDAEYAAAYDEAKANAEAHPMSDSSLRGEDSFFGNKAWCSVCHNGVNFTDELYHNIGIGLDAEQPDLGRFKVTKKAEDWGGFQNANDPRCDLHGTVYARRYTCHARRCYRMVRS